MCSTVVARAQSRQARLIRVEVACAWSKRLPEARRTGPTRGVAFAPRRKHTHRRARPDITKPGFSAHPARIEARAAARGDSFSVTNVVDCVARHDRRAMLAQRVDGR